MKVFALVACFLLSATANATTWAIMPPDAMLRTADLIAVCRVTRYPAEEISEGHSVLPGYIKLQVLRTLRGKETDVDLLVDWGDFTRNSSIKEGMEVVAFLHRGDPTKRIEYWGVSTNAAYGRLHSEFWIREITNDKITWANRRSYTIAQFTKLVNAKSNLPPPRGNR